MKSNEQRKIPVLCPTIDSQTEKELIKVLRSGWWGNGGKVLEFEKEFAKYVGAKFAVAVNSCTSALDLALKVYDIKGGELITTPMTFVSDAIVAEWNGMDCTFADIDPATLCIDPKAIKITPQTKAIIAVDSHGRLADIKAIKAKFSGLVIEDAAHAMYTPRAGKEADITVWSFQAVKTLPTGDGGMITTNDEQIAKKLKGMIWLGVEKSTYDRVGQSYTWDYDIQHGGQKSYMTDMTAVIGLGQLKRLDKTNARRREIQTKYKHAFLGKEWFHKLQDSFTVQYYTQCFKDRDKLGEYLGSKGITTSVHFKPLSEMSYYKKYKKNPLPVTDTIWPRLLSLPVHNALTNSDIDFIIRSVLEFYENIS
jgi:perosamine synthetase